MDSALWLIPVFAPVIVAAFVGGSILIRSIASRGGLAVLVRRYTTRLPCPDQVLTKQNAQIGSTSWKAHVTIGLGQRGLYLHAKPPLLRYPAIEIPWSHLRYERETSLNGSTGARITVVPPQVSMVLPVEVWKQAEPFLKR